mmetsp:Transcript_93448/g.302589  ORF Transcript_93448/g.302589 Transcript_93448/m.302589 type:complete len:222 (+) Transcript_93448:479-1144(+)
MAERLRVQRLQSQPSVIKPHATLCGGHGVSSCITDLGHGAPGDGGPGQAQRGGHGDEAVDASVGRGVVALAYGSEEARRRREHDAQLHRPSLVRARAVQVPGPEVLGAEHVLKLLPGLPNDQAIGEHSGTVNDALAWGPVRRLQEAAGHFAGARHVATLPLDGAIRVGDPGVQRHGLLRHAISSRHEVQMSGPALQHDQGRNQAQATHCAGDQVGRARVKL